jgi:hypothetical protein
MTIGSASSAATMRTFSPSRRMPIPLPCRPDWLRTSCRAAGSRSSTDFGVLKYEGQRGAGYFSPLAPTAALAAALDAAGAGVSLLQAAVAAAAAHRPAIHARAVFSPFVMFRAP